MATVVVTIFCLPETIYSRRSAPGRRERSFVDLLLFRHQGLQSARIRPRDFARPLYMLRYLSVLIPGVYYMTAFGFGSVLFAATGASLFRELYGFGVAQTGLMLSVPLLAGCLLGEMSAGWLTDRMVYRYARAHGGRREPEARLDAVLLAVLCPVGIIVEGVCLSRAGTVSWVGAAVGMGIANYGVQIANTVTYTYCTDVRPSHLVSCEIFFGRVQLERLTLAAVLQAPELRDIVRAQPHAQSLLHDHFVLRVSSSPVHVAGHLSRRSL